MTVLSLAFFKPRSSNGFTTHLIARNRSTTSPKHDTPNKLQCGIPQARRRARVIKAELILIGGEQTSAAQCHRNQKHKGESVLLQRPP